MKIFILHLLNAERNGTLNNERERSVSDKFSERVIHCSKKKKQDKAQYCILMPEISKMPILLNLAFENVT